MSENDKPKIKLSELTDIYDIENDTQQIIPKSGPDPEDMANPEETEFSITENTSKETHEEKMERELEEEFDRNA